MIEHQEKDGSLQPILAYLKEGIVPEEETIARKLVLEATQYDNLNGVLCHENPNNPGSWRIVVLRDMRSNLLEEFHGGKFSGHFAWRKLYYTMKKRFWWKGMCGDVEKLSVLSWMCYKERIWDSNEASFVSNPCRWTFSQSWC